jgi:hypothetical protein
MIKNWQTTILQQLGAAIDMLENAMRECPQNIWGDRAGYHEFWYMAYHTLFFLDYYFSESAEGFRPPAPYTLGELDPAGVLPDRVYTKDELLTYLEHCRQKCRRVINALTEESAHQHCVFEWLDLTVVELMLYNIRHVQHHTAQLNLLLRQRDVIPPRWVRKTKLSLIDR